MSVKESAEDGVLIYYKGSFLIMLLLLGLLLLALGVMPFCRGLVLKNIEYIVNNIWVVFVLSIGTSFVFVSVPPLVTRKPVLIVDKSGITDNFSIFSPGLIKWADIEAMWLPADYLGLRLRIYLKDSTSFFCGRPLWQRWNERASLKTGGSHVSIPLLGLTISPQEIVSRIHMYIPEPPLPSSSDGAKTIPKGRQD